MSQLFSMPPDPTEAMRERARQDRERSVRGSRMGGDADVDAFDFGMSFDPTEFDPAGMGMSMAQALTVALEQRGQGPMFVPREPMRTPGAGGGAPFRTPGVTPVDPLEVLLGDFREQANNARQQRREAVIEQAGKSAPRLDGEDENDYALRVQNLTNLLLQSEGLVEGPQDIYQVERPDEQLGIVQGAGRAIGRGVIGGSAGGVAGALRMIESIEPESAPGMLAGLGADAVGQFAQDIREGMPPSPSVQRQGALPDFSSTDDTVRFFTERGTEAVSQLLTTLLPGAGAGRALQAAGAGTRAANLGAVLTASGFGGSQEAEAAYRERKSALLEAGVPEPDAERMAVRGALATFGVVAALENIPAGEFLVRNPAAREQVRQGIARQLAGRIGRGMAVEGPTEALQSFGSGVAQSMVEGTPDALKGLDEILGEGLMGTIAGGFAGGALGGAEIAANRRATAEERAVNRLDAQVVPPRLQQEAAQQPAQAPETPPAASDPATAQDAVETPASQQAEPVATEPDAVPDFAADLAEDAAPPPVEDAGPAAPRSRSKGEFTRKAVEDRLQRVTEGYRGATIESAEQGAIESEATEQYGQIDFNFAGDLPTEIRQALQGEPPSVRTQFRANQKNGLGDDTMSSIGADRMIEIARERAEGQLTGARRAAVEMGDPEAAFLAYLLDKMDESGTPRTNFQIVDNPAGLPEGATFEIKGEQFVVEKRDDGLTVLADGGEFIADALDSIPIDRGSLDTEAGAVRDEVDVSDLPGLDDAPVTSQPRRPASGGVQRDMFGNPFADPATGSQQDIPFTVESTLERETAEAQELEPVEAGQSRLDELLQPGDPFTGLGATEQPGAERSLRTGEVRTATRSARDLLGRGADKPGADPIVTLSGDAEARFQAANGINASRTLSQRFDAFLEKIKQETMRGSFRFLPRSNVQIGGRTVNFGQVRADLLRVRKALPIAHEKAKDVLDRITNVIKPGSGEFDLFRKAVVLRDLVNHDPETFAGESGGVFGYSSVEQVQQDLAALERAVAEHPRVQAALRFRDMAWERHRADYIDSMRRAGVDVSGSLTRPNYFRHQVIAYAQAKGNVAAGVGQKLRTPASRSFLKRRTGLRGKDINTDYFSAELEVFTQMLTDQVIADAIGNLKATGLDIYMDIRAEAAEQEVDWETLVPEGYEVWAPRPGRVLFLAHSIGESAAMRLFDTVAEGAGMDAEQVAEFAGKVRQVVALGSPHTPMVIPSQLAAQLDEINPNLGAAIEVVKPLTRAWKAFRLMGPTSFLRYSIRNASEFDKVLVARPEALDPRNLAAAARDLALLFRGSEDAPAMVQQWAEMGGVLANMRVQETGDVSALEDFAKLVEKHQSKNPIKRGARIISFPFWGYWRAAKLTNDFRESVLRYAIHRTLVREMRATPDGLPAQGATRPRFVASNPDQIRAIRSIEERAYTMSNELLGAYDDVSITGQRLRESIIPFWSFQELNARAWWRMFANVFADEGISWQMGAALIGKTAARRAPWLAIRAGSTFLKGAALWASLQAVNSLWFPDEEDDLPEDVRYRPHITLGRNADGSVRYFHRLGTMGDLLEWVGMDAPYEEIKDYIEGRRTLDQITKGIATSPVNKVAQAISPVVKGPIEAITGFSVFPDFTQPRRIRDRWEYFFDQWGLGDEYRKVRGLPGKPYAERVATLPFYTIEPNKASYWHARELAFRWKRKQDGGGSFGFSDSAKSDALYNYKLSVRYGDEDGMRRYLAEYAALGGTPKDLSTSLGHLNPMSTLSRQDRRAFVESLSETDRRELRKAMRYYRDSLLGADDATSEMLNAELQSQGFTTASLRGISDRLRRRSEAEERQLLGEPEGTAP